MTARRQTTRSVRRSFTLVEVLIAIGLSLALLSSVFTFYFNVLRIRGKVQEQADVQRAATTLIERLERELMTCMVTADGQQAGVRGDGTTLTLASRGMATALAERGTDEPKVFSDLQVTTYRFDAASKRLTMRRDGEQSDSSDANSASLLSGRIAKVRFRYYDGAQWREQFDSRAADALPIAVEVAIWFDPFGEETLDETSATAGADREQPAERETFDASGGFDEFEFAMRDDRGFGEQTPLPDRWRIISVPDAEAPEQAGGGGAP